MVSSAVDSLFKLGVFVVSDQAICYEQPLNELMRVCLRLEHLFKQVKQTVSGETKWHAKTTLRIFSDCLAIVDRPDLKPRIIKECHRYLETLRRWQASPTIDRERLQQMIDRTEHVIAILQQSQSRLIGSELEEDFIAHVRQNISVPAGDCSFSMPRLHYWLHNAPEQRIQDCQRWWAGFDVLRHVIEFMMSVVRLTTQFKEYEARTGLFQASLDPTMPSQICSVEVSANMQVYPEISVGRHGINLRFMNPREGQRPTQVQANIPFRLSICVI